MPAAEAPNARAGLPRPRNATKAVVRIERALDGGCHVVKTVRGRPLLCRRGPGAFLLRREARLLARAAHLDVVPQLVKAEREAFVTEFVPGPTVSDLRHEGLDPTTAERVRRAVARFHDAGFAHGGLGRRDIVLSPGGRVVLLDLATAIDGRGARGVRRLLFRFARWKDRRRVDRILANAVARWERAQQAATGSLMQPCRSASAVSA